MFKNVRNTRSTSLVAVLTLASLAGCGVAPHTGIQADAVSMQAAAPRVFAIGGQPTLLVKLKPSRTPLKAVPSCHRVRATTIPGVEIHAVGDGNLQKAIAAYKADPGVEYVEVNQVMSIPETKAVLRSMRVKAGQDVNFPGEYAPKLTHALDVQAKVDGTGQIIAIVDTGVDLTHPDLAPKLVAGTNTVDATGDAHDTEGHGTNCAGIAASLKDDKGGIIGMAPGAKIMPVKVLGEGGSGSDASVAEGIIWAADHGANVISLSLGGAGASQTGGDAIKHALAKGCTVVAAMGNNGTGQKSFPAAYPGVIAVGATDINDAITSFSQFGSWISVSAPGYSILSTFPTYHVAEMDSYAQEKDFWETHGMRATQTYGYLTGTSQATPGVSGLAALVKAANPTLTPDQVKSRIEAASAHPVAMAGAFDVHFGHGRIDALKAI
jgi:thermitase